MRALCWIGLLLVGCTADEPPDTRPPQAAPGVARALVDRDYLPAALDAIRSARASVRVAQFVVQDDPVVHELLDALEGAAARGVRVRVLADEEGADTPALLDGLAARGVEARLDGSEVVLHTKLVVADDVAIVGSHNWTWSALQANTEASLLAQAPDVAAWYAGWFDAVWAAPDDMPELDARIGDLRPLADRDVVDAARSCIEGADERIELVMYALRWDEGFPGSSVDRLLTAIEEAIARGVAVSVVLDRSAWTVEHAVNAAAAARLRQAGADLRWAPTDTITHAKVLRCDASVLVSDANWTHGGLDLDHGTSLLGASPELASTFAAWFASIHGASTPP